MTPKVDKTHIEAKISELKVAIAAAPNTYAESKAAALELNATYNDLDALKKNSAEENTAMFDALHTKVQHYSDQNQLDRYNETMQADLMFCPKKYVVTDTEQLVSPAGFAIDSNIYYQTKIAIHTDSLKGIPQSNVELYGHKTK